jgi:hypothetical protein
MTHRNFRRALRLALGLMLSACVQHPKPPVAYEAATVKASFGRTWAATLDELSRRTIPLKSADRESGVIITDALHLDQTFYQAADCGSDGFSPFVATQGSFSVLVRDDSTQSTVRISARWISVSTGAEALCSTRGTWEKGFQEAVRDAAEKRP